MTRMRVTKPHRFNGKLMGVGDEYDTRAHDNVPLIKALGFATPVEGAAAPAPSKQSYKTRDMAAEGRETRGRRARSPEPPQEDQVQAEVAPEGESVSAHGTEDLPDTASKSEEDSTEVGIDELREKYESTLGFAADRRWGRERLQRAIDEAS